MTSEKESHQETAHLLRNDGHDSNSEDSSFSLHSPTRLPASQDHAVECGSEGMDHSNTRIRKPKWNQFPTLCCQWATTSVQCLKAALTQGKGYTTKNLFNSQKVWPRNEPEASRTCNAQFSVSSSLYAGSVNGVRKWRYGSSMAHGVLMMVCIMSCMHQSKAQCLPYCDLDSATTLNPRCPCPNSTIYARDLIIFL
jgi:hypothetical protein